MDIVGTATLEAMSGAHFYNKWLFDQIEPYLQGDILEVGSGIGNISRILARKGSLIGIDYSSGYVKELQKLGLNAKFGLGNIEKGKYFFGKKKFDSIVCMNVLEHIRGDVHALKNMHALLRTGGKLVLLVPAHQFAFGSMDANLGHFRRYNKKTLSKKLVTAGFRIEDTFYLNMLGLLGWWFNGKVLGRSTLPSNQLALFDEIAKPFLTLENFIKPLFGLSVVAIATE